ncbi:MAG TPA: hypothetical protein VHU17_21905, partial [Acidimicrobiales bacterium]|nr:hypothetical protein [Acidimicrobiales bacterium]
RDHGLDMLGSVTEPVTRDFWVHSVSIFVLAHKHATSTLSSTLLSLPGSKLRVNELMGTSRQKRGRLVGPSLHGN